MAKKKLTAADEAGGDRIAGTDSWKPFALTADGEGYRVFKLMVPIDMSVENVMYWLCEGPAKGVMVSTEGNDDIRSFVLTLH